jgi:hypothetical protein
MCAPPDLPVVSLPHAKARQKMDQPEQMSTSGETQSLGDVGGCPVYTKAMLPRKSLMMVESGAAKPLAQVVVAQAWWDAAYNAAIGQRHTTNERATPLVRSESRRYRRPLR